MRDYLRKYLPEDLYESTIEPFGQYTLEGIIISVLGLVFNSIKESSIVRVSTLLDKLDSTVRTQSNRKKKLIVTGTAKNSKDGNIKRKRVAKYSIGTRMLEFMMDRNWIHIEESYGNKAVVNTTV